MLPYCKNSTHFGDCSIEAKALYAAEIVCFYPLKQQQKEMFLQIHLQSNPVATNMLKALLMLQCKTIETAIEQLYAEKQHSS